MTGLLVPFLLWGGNRYRAVHSGSDRATVFPGASGEVRRAGSDDVAGPRDVASSVAQDGVVAPIAPAANLARGDAGVDGGTIKKGQRVRTGSPKGDTLPLPEKDFR